MSDDQIAASKAGIAWFGVGIAKGLSSIGIHTWSDFAALCAATYSLLLIAGWLRRALRKESK